MNINGMYNPRSFSLTPATFPAHRKSSKGKITNMYGNSFKVSKYLSEHIIKGTRRLKHNHNTVGQPSDYSIALKTIKKYILTP
jgi:hypothetical protein